MLSGILHHLMHIRYLLGLLMRKFVKMSAKLSYSQKYRTAVAQNAINSVVFMYHKAMNIFLGSKTFLNLVYFWLFQKYIVFKPRVTYQ